jgi:universal stress protein E
MTAARFAAGPIRLARTLLLREGDSPMSSRSWKSILVAVRDPVGRKQIALRKAARIAACTGAEITLFHAFSSPLVLPVPPPSDPDEILRVVAKQRRDQLLKLARPLRAEGLAVRCEVVWDFPPAHAIVRRVLETKPDLVVAESHRHTRLARWFLANSDWELIRECPCPVWFVKHERFPKRPVILTAVDPTHAHAKPSGLDARLLEQATFVRRQLDGRIALIHVEDTTRMTPPTTGAAKAVTKPALDRLALRNGIDDATTVLRAGKPADVLTASAAELQADLLVMGAVSRSGLSHSHIGNTAEAVIDDVTCDVLVVKPRRFKTAVPRKHPTLPNGSR